VINKTKVKLLNVLYSAFDAVMTFRLQILSFIHQLQSAVTIPLTNIRIFCQEAFYLRQVQGLIFTSTVAAFSSRYVLFLVSDRFGN